MPLFWAAGIVAAGAIGSAVVGSQSADKATAAQGQSSAAAIAEQQREYNIGQQNQAPWLQVGTGALNQLATLYGIAPYTGPAPGTGTGTGGAGNITAGMQIVQAMNGGLLPGQTSRTSGLNAATAITDQGAIGSGILGIKDPVAEFLAGSPVGTAISHLFGSNNATPIQDIAAAIKAGHPVTDSDWAKAGFGPGGSIPGQQTAGTGTGNTTGTGTGPTLAQANPTTPVANGVAQGPVAAVQANGAPNLANFWQSPDYQFRLQQGLDGVNAGAAARGSLDSGATRKAEIDYSGNLAAGDYNNYANRLAALAGVGQTTATNTANQGQAYANTVGNILTNQGNNLASSYLAKGANYGNTIGSLAGIGSGLIQNNPGLFSGSGGGYATYANGNWTPGAQGFPA